MIDPGHNGGNASHSAEINRQVFIGNGSKECDTTGTSTTDGYPEYEFTLDVADRLKDLLEGQRHALFSLGPTATGGVRASPTVPPSATTTMPMSPYQSMPMAGPLPDAASNVITPRLVADTTTGSSAHPPSSVDVCVTPIEQETPMPTATTSRPPD